MSLPQHLLRDVGGTVSLELLTRPTSNVTVSVYKHDGAAVVEDKSCTISSVDTTLNGAHVIEQTAISVANATGISEGTAFWLRDPNERVVCKTVTGTIVELWDGLMFAHSTGVTVEGTSATYTVSGSDASDEFWDGRAKWSVDGTYSEMTAVECTIYSLPRRATIQDVIRKNPRILDELDANANVEDLLNSAHEDLLTDIGSKGRARVFTGSAEFSAAVASRFLVNHYQPMMGDEAERLYDRWKEVYALERDKAVAITPRDADQDGEVEAHEVLSLRNVPLTRS